MESMDLEEMFGVTRENIEKWDFDAREGTLPGDPSGETVAGPGMPASAQSRCRESEAAENGER